MSGLLPATCALQIAFYIPHPSRPPNFKRVKARHLGPSID